MTAKAVRTRVWRNGTLERENFPFEEFSDYLEQPDCLVWADLLAPDYDMICQLADELSLDQHAVEDSLGEHERPKASRYATHLFLTTYAIVHDKDSQDLIGSRISAFSLPRGFVTVRLDDNFDIDEVVRRWDQNNDLLKFGTKALIHGLLDEIVDGYFDAVEGLDDDVEAIEDLLFDENPKVANTMQRRTFALRKSLVQIRRVVLPMREVVNTVMRRAAEDEHNAELGPYFDDLYDHVLRAADWTESLRDIISSIFETTLSLADARMNTVMKKLTGWAAIIAVPTAITGYFGQNIPFPGFGRPFGFWQSVITIVVSAAVLYWVFKRKDWL